MNSPYLFQYCQKLVVFSADRRSVLFARRSGEADFDEYWSFIGGKLETTDASLEEGIKREKDEEVSSAFRIRVATGVSCYNILFRKKDGSAMVLPHYIALHVDGEVQLNKSEYTEYAWVPIDQLDDFGPKIDNTPTVIQSALRLLPVLKEADFVVV